MELVSGVKMATQKLKAWMILMMAWQAKQH